MGGIWDYLQHSAQLAVVQIPVNQHVSTYYQNYNKKLLTNPATPLCAPLTIKIRPSGNKTRSFIILG